MMILFNKRLFLGLPTVFRTWYQFSADTKQSQLSMIMQRLKMNVTKSQ